MWSTLSTNKKQHARESFPALTACSCDCFEFLLVPSDCMPLLWVTWLTRIVYLYSFWFYDAQLKTFQLDDTLTYHGVTDQGPLWCGLSATFQISWVNSTILLNSSSAAYKNWRKKQFIFLLSTGPDHRPSTFSLETVGCVLLCSFFLAFCARSHTHALLARSTKNVHGQAMSTRTLTFLSL